MAAGMSAVFGTPIGAVVYVLEESGAEWTKTLALRTLFCSMVSSFTVNMLLSLQDTMVSDYGLITLGVSGTYSYNWLELVAFVLLGFIGMTSSFSLLLIYCPSLLVLVLQFFLSSCSCSSCSTSH
jgi:chloride channel 7